MQFVQCIEDQLVCVLAPTIQLRPAADLYFKNYHTVARGNPNYFITYGNGKSAARVQRGLRPNGAHRWHSYVKTPK